jgi:hypothetical protein
MYLLRLFAFMACSRLKFTFAFIIIIIIIIILLLLLEVKVKVHPTSGSESPRGGVEV